MVPEDSLMSMSALRLKDGDPRVTANPVVDVHSVVVEGDLATPSSNT
jgi:hypothetical protein